MCQISVKVVGEKRMPCIVSQMYQIFACMSQFSYQIILLNRCASKIRTSVNECGQCPGSQTLQSLERGRRRIGNEGQKEGVLWFSYRSLMKHLERIMEVLSFAGVWHSEVVSQGINYNYDCFIKAFGMPASVLVRAYTVCRKNYWGEGAF